MLVYDWDTMVHQRGGKHNPQFVSTCHENQMACLWFSKHFFDFYKQQPQACNLSARREAQTKKNASIQCGKLCSRRNVKQ